MRGGRGGDGTGSGRGQVASREEGKQQRRREILRAARELMRRGDVAFTMRALAETANVSIATPYNLFGSKQAVMFAVLERDLAAYADAVGARTVPAPDVFFRAVDLAAEHYGRDPDYHRSVLFAAYSDGGREYRSLFAGPGHALWRDMVAAGIESGRLRPTVHPDALAASLEQQLFACVLEWVRGELGLEELVLRAHYGFALMLLGVVAREADRTALDTRLQHAQARLLDRWSAGGAEPATRHPEDAAGAR
jgi:AcrR family transcriptional regulator